MTGRATGRTSLRLVALIALVIGAVVVASCGVPSSGGFEAFTDENELGFGATTTTSTTAPPSTVPATTDAATTTTIETEPVTLYFLVGIHASSVSIVLARPATPLQVLSALADGPPAGQVGTGLRSALPPNAEFGVEHTRSGVLVTVPEGFFSTIPLFDQRLAVAQIVLTLTERGGVGTVQFQQGSVPLAVPKGSGASSAPGEAVYRDDYLGVLAADQVPTPTSTQPPAAATATTVVPAGAAAVATSTTIAGGALRG